MTSGDKPLADLQVIVTALDQEWNVIATRTLQSSAFGMVHSNFAIPPERMERSIYLQVSSADNEWLESNFEEVLVTTEEAPRFIVEVISESRVAVGGDPWRGDIQVRSLLDEPVPGAGVQVTEDEQPVFSGVTDRDGKIEYEIETDSDNEEPGQYFPQYKDRIFSVSARHPVFFEG